MFRTVRKRLLCPVCGDLVAVATSRWWGVSLVLTAPDGSRIIPTRGAIAVEQAERDLASSPAALRDQAQDRLAFVHANPIDLIFRLRCRHEHTVLRTAPQLLRAMRRSQGTWIDVQ